MALESQNDVDAEDKNRPKRHVLKLLKLVLRFLVVALKWPVRLLIRLLNCSLEKLGKCGYDGLKPLRKIIPPYLPDGQTFFANAVVEIAGTVSAGAGVVFLTSVAGAAYNQTQARWLFVTFFAIELFLAFCMAMLPEEIESESTENVKKGARLTWAGLAIITILLDLLLFIPQFHALVTRSIFPTRSTIVISATWVRGISLAIMVLGYLFTRYIAKVVEPLVRFKSDGKPQSDNDLAVNQRHKLSGSC